MRVAVFEEGRNGWDEAWTPKPGKKPSKRVRLQNLFVPFITRMTNSATGAEQCDGAWRTNGVCDALRVACGRDDDDEMLMAVRGNGVPLRRHGAGIARTNVRRAPRTMTGRQAGRHGRHERTNKRPESARATLKWLAGSI